MAKEKSKRELSEIKRVQDASKLADEVWVLIQTATQYALNPNTPIRDLELAIQKSNELLSKLEAEFKVISQYSTKHEGADKVYDFLKFEPRMELETLEDTLAMRKMSEEKKQIIEAAETLSDASSDISEHESLASSELNSSDSTSTLDEKTNKEIEDARKKAPPEAFVQAKNTVAANVQPNIPQPETSKPEKSKPNLLTRIMNGIRDLFKGSHSQKNTSGGSMGKIIQGTNTGNLSPEEMKTNMEANKQAKRVETKSSADKEPLTASKIEKQLPTANWFKDDEKQENTRPTLGGHRRL